MIFDLIENNDIEGLKKVLFNTHPNWVDQFGYSALHIAISKDYEEIAEILIKAGIDLNLKDPKGQSALHYCAFYNRPEMARLILQSGGRLDIQDDFGNEPLWTAVIRDKGFGRHTEIVKIFIEAGADKNHENNVKKTPFGLAKELEYDEVLAIMLA